MFGGAGVCRMFTSILHPLPAKSVSCAPAAETDILGLANIWLGNMMWCVEGSACQWVTRIHRGLVWRAAAVIQACLMSQWQRTEKAMLMSAGSQTLRHGPPPILPTISHLMTLLSPFHDPVSLLSVSSIHAADRSSLQSLSALIKHYHSSDKISSSCLKWVQSWNEFINALFRGDTWKRSW